MLPLKFYACPMLHKDSLQKLEKVFFLSSDQTVSNAVNV